MKNKKGFTLVELLVVIIILGMVAGIATISITRQKQKANNDEKITMRQTIISSFENYRLDDINANRISINDLEFSSSLSYDNKKCKNDSSNGTITYIIKKNKIYNIDNITATDIEKEALRNKLSSSLEEVFCVQYTCNGQLIIDDENNNEVNEILKYEKDSNKLLTTTSEENEAKQNGKEIIVKQFKVNYCK